ncbi:hypothetical protein L1887_48081 [Cichorium endivia]|nr:hypothetical protein L1887_48081 [Cichorium endivia]
MSEASCERMHRGRLGATGWVRSASYAVKKTGESTQESGTSGATSFTRMKLVGVVHVWRPRSSEWRRGEVRDESFDASSRTTAGRVSFKSNLLRHVSFLLAGPKHALLTFMLTMKLFVVPATVVLACLCKAAAYKLDAEDGQAEIGAYHIQPGRCAGVEQRPRPHQVQPVLPLESVPHIVHELGYGNDVEQMDSTALCANNPALTEGYGGGFDQDAHLPRVRTLRVRYARHEGHAESFAPAECKSGSDCRKPEDRSKVEDKAPTGNPTVDPVHVDNDGTIPGRVVSPSTPSTSDIDAALLKAGERTKKPTLARGSSRSSPTVKSPLPRSRQRETPTCPLAALNSSPQLPMLQSSRRRTATSWNTSRHRPGWASASVLCLARSTPEVHDGSRHTLVHSASATFTLISPLSL